MVITGAGETTQSDLFVTPRGHARPMRWTPDAGVAAGVRSIGFPMRPQGLARRDFEVFCWKTVVFSWFHVEIAAKTNVLEGFRHARAHVARMVSFDRDSHIMHVLVHVERENVDFALVFYR